MSCPGESSGLLTGATQITTAQGVFQAATVTGGTLVVYDSENSTTTGKKVIMKLVSTTESVTGHIDDGTSFMKGLYVTLTAGDAIVHFRRGA